MKKVLMIKILKNDKSMLFEIILIMKGVSGKKRRINMLVGKSV